MKHWSILAALLNAAATAIVNELGGVTPGEETAAGDTQEAPVKRRGRPPGSTNAPAAPAAPEEEKAPAAQVGKSIEELRALIQPIVEAGNQAEVKALIVKHAGKENAKLSEIPPQNHAAFVKDVSALDM